MQWSGLSFLGSKYNYESLKETMALWGRLLSWKILNLLHCLSPGLNNNHRSNAGYNEFVSPDSVKIPSDKTREELQGQQELDSDDNFLEFLGLCPPPV